MQQRPQSRGGDDTAIYHGHQEETKQADLTAYFRRIDESLRKTLPRGTAPLVFAGVDYLYPLYRQVNGYPALCEQSVAGNPDDLTPQSLHERAWAIVQPIFEARERSALTSLAERQSEGTATDNLATLLIAARDGLVETLIFPQQSSLYGRFAPKSGQVEVYPQGGNGEHDLIDQAVLLTLQASGEVLVVDRDEWPPETPAAALLRAPRSTIAT